MSRVVSNYPAWWNTTITVYNKYVDSITDRVTWHRTVLTNCFWKYTVNKLTINKVTLDTNTIVCRIPQDTLFKRKSEWVALPNDQMSQYFTLGVGDIIVEGEVDDVIDEYTAGSRSTDLLNKYTQYSECIEIGAVAINVGGGRNHPHYYVSDGSTRAWNY